MNKPTKPKSLGKLAVLQQQIADLTEALKRERADAENLRRRHEEQIGGLQNMVKASVVRDFLPVIDNYERLLAHSAAVSKNGSWKQGVEQISKQLEKALADIGVERIKTVGEAFDPHLHEAVHMEEAPLDSGRTVEVVCEELQPGYKLGDNVIRHAMVKVRLQA